jgi:hypothetical protein
MTCGDFCVALADQSADPEGLRWPRSKIRDDATAVYWTLD